MPRYDSDEEKKKRKKKKKKRSRSRSVSSGDSRLSSKHKKSKKSKHHRRSPSPSPERSRRRSRSRSRRRSPSLERGRYRSRSRSRSRDRYSRRRSRSRDRRSRSYDRRSRSSSRSRRRSRYSRSLSRDRQRSKRSRSKERRRDKSPKNKATEDIPGFADMTPAEQAQARMHMALKAAAAADEKIKEQLTGSAAGTGSKTHQEQLQFSNAIKDIESSSFVQSSFVSNRYDKEKTGSKKEEEFSFGTAAEFKPDMAVKKILEVDDLSKLAHSNGYSWLCRHAAADEKIKEQLTGSAAGTGSKTHQEQLQFSNAIKDIESSSFIQSSFVSNRYDKEKTGSKKEEEFSFGTAAEFKPDMAVKKILEVDDLSKLAHSNLCVDPEVKMDQWVERLKSLRQKKLEGEVIK